MDRLGHPGDLDAARVRAGIASTWHRIVIWVAVC
jgi:hypothetical protein